MGVNSPPIRDERIVVTGVGLSTSLGFGKAVNWERLLAGDSSITKIPKEKFKLPIKLPIRFGAVIPRDALAAKVRKEVPRTIWNTSEEACHLWLITALEAMEQAGCNSQGNGAFAPERAGVFVGSGVGPINFTEQEFANIYSTKNGAKRDINRMAVSKFMTSSLAGQLSILAGFRGPCISINTACSSGSTAITLALDALRLGRIDCAVTGGVDLPVTASVLKGFSKLSALSNNKRKGVRPSRPFEADRDGFVLGEGAACLILEREETAQAHGKKILAVLRGGASSSEAHHLISPKDNGEEMARTIKLALEDAGLDGKSVAHVYSHGTGSHYNDICEAAALNQVFPHRPTLSATKAQLGHTIGAAGAIDAALAVLTLNSGQVIPMTHLKNPDPDCDINPALTSLHKALSPGSKKAVLVNTFAFGGHNAVLVFTGP